MKIQKNKKMILLWFFGLVLSGGLYVALSFLSDPLSLFSKPKDNKYSNYPRHSAASIIRHADFDSIILGASMLQNTSSKETSRILGGKFVNLSMGGSTYRVRSLPLRKVLRVKSIKQVIYSLDYTSMPPKENIDYDFLYNDFYLDDIRLYLTPKYLPCLFVKTLCYLSHKDIDRLEEWMSDESFLKRFGGFDKWLKFHNSVRVKATLQNILNKQYPQDFNVTWDKNLSLDINIKNYFEDNILVFIRQYPKTQFYLIFPPYSILHFRLNPSSLKQRFIALKYLLEEVQILPNVKIFAWWDKDFTTDIALYRDLKHYHEDINSKMLKWIRDDEGLMTLQNYDAYTQKVYEKVKKYDIEALHQRAKTYFQGK